MVGPHWFVHPVADGIELVINSKNCAVYDRALAEFVTHFLDYDLVDEWSTEDGEVLRFVPAPANASAVPTADTQTAPHHLPAPRSAPEVAEAC
ncbi:MAG TPA: hypothetical protein VHV82_06145 [Sporichthyaceae bacterium]|jgi:hypothetical protein|nr:hypothetical protein [Sporichthyaceae bacterium]